MKILSKILEYIYPSNIYCICCGSIINENHNYSICDYCMEEIDWVNERRCVKCGRQIFEYTEKDMVDQGDCKDKKEVCVECEDKNHNFDKAYTCMVYNSRAKNIIKKYKFQGESYISEKLADIMADKIKFEEISADLITAVPSHIKKMKERGYNPAELVAKGVAQKIGTPFDGNLLKRIRYEKAMNKLTKTERSFNVMGSYDGNFNKSLDDKRIILIDDIYTTGSTVEVCSEILKNMGAKSVTVITVASGVVEQ